MVRAHHRAKHRATEHAEFLFGQLTAMVANTGFRGWKDPRTADEFMPSRIKAKPRAQRIDRQAVADKLRRVMQQLMARQNGEQG